MATKAENDGIHVEPIHQALGRTLSVSWSLRSIQTLHRRVSRNSAPRLEPPFFSKYHLPSLICLQSVEWINSRTVATIVFKSTSLFQKKPNHDDALAGLHLVARIDIGHSLCSSAMVDVIFVESTKSGLVGCL